MDFSPYQQNGKFTSPNTNYTEPLRVHADNSGGMALAKQGGLAMPLLKGYLSYKETVDNVKSMEANNEYNRLMSEGTVQLMQRKEEKAVNILEDYDKLHQKTLETVRKKYGSYINYGDAAIAFNNYTTRDNATRRANMMKYQLSETDKWQETQFNNSLATCNQMVLDGGGTDEAIEEASERMATLVQGRYANYGNDKIKEQERLLKGELVSSALSLAMKMEDYPRMGQLATRYAQYLTPQARISVLSMYGKRQRDARDMAQANDLFSMLGENATRDDYKNAILQGYASKDEIGKRFSHYESLLGEEMPNGRNGCVEGFLALTKPFFKFSQDNESEVNVGSVCRLAQQSDGVKIERYHGGEIPEGAGIIYFSEGDDITDFDNAEHITMSDGNGGFYGNSSSAKDYEDESGNYVRGNGCIIHSDDKEIGGYQIGYVIRMDEQTAREMSDLEAEEKTDKMWTRHQKRMSAIKGVINEHIAQGSLEQQDLINQGVEDPSAYDAIALKYYEASGFRDEVRIALEKQGGHLRNIIRKQAEREAARAAGTGGGRSGGGSGRNGGGSGKKNSDPFFNTNLEIMLRNGCSREQAYDLISRENPSGGKEAINLVNNYFAGKEKYSVDWDDYEQKLADYCEVKKSDGDFKILFGQATNYAYELMMQYRDEHGGKDPTSQQILEYLIDGVTKTRIDTGERSWFGFGEAIYEESPLTPAEWLNRGVYNDPAENYDEATGRYKVQTRRGFFYATEEQYERIVDGESADVVLAGQYPPPVMFSGGEGADVENEDEELE